MNRKNNNEFPIHVDILWTGGFDSTFRICQLSLQPVEIQPYYILDHRRKSYKNELSAISRIIKYLQKKDTTKCKILSLVVVRDDEISLNKEVSDSFNRIYGEYVIGRQYDYLARFAHQYNLNLELGWELSLNGSNIGSVFNKYGVFKTVKECVQDVVVEYIEPDFIKCSEDFLKVFGRFRFGLPLYNMTKLEASDEYIRLGFKNVIKMTWFCSHPIMGRPCGLCNPCETVIKSNMGYRLPITSKVLYSAFKANSLGKIVNNRLKVIYNTRFRHSRLSSRAFSRKIQ
ncbi:MAG: hypothetical protein JW717_12950 [Marinilabiliaceae bacterium]|nr:hypothetical protein [Marinilabiliaceae bacterium]